MPWSKKAFSTNIPAGFLFSCYSHCGILHVSFKKEQTILQANSYPENTPTWRILFFVVLFSVFTVVIWPTSPSSRISCRHEIQPLCPQDNFPSPSSREKLKIHSGKSLDKILLKPKSGLWKPQTPCTSATLTWSINEVLKAERGQRTTSFTV